MAGATVRNRCFRTPTRNEKASSRWGCSAIHILFPDYLAVIEDGKPLSELEHLNQTARQMLDQLAWWSAAIKAAREKRLRRAA